nr:NADH dehydrogenase subunit 2 [Lilioceris yunnana]
MMHFYKILFFLVMIFGTFIVISSYSWFGIWVGLEINLMAILPLMTSNNNKFPAEAALKYFITQVFASTMLLMSMIIFSMEQEFLNLNSFQFMEIIFNIALLIKLGMAPFHVWFPEVLEGLNWKMCLLMLTWQKIAPMMVLMLYCNKIYFLTTMIMISTLISSIIGLNQISMRKIMAYSSINHMAWMMSIIITYKSMWMIYFIIYSIITITLVMTFMKFNIYTTKQLFNIFEKNKILNLINLGSFLSLGGLPPFLGFLPKWIALTSLVKAKLWFTSLVLIIFTLIVLFFYLRLTMPSFLLTKNETQWTYQINKFKIFWFQIISIVSLPLCTLILIL